MPGPAKLSANEEPRFGLLEFRGQGLRVQGLGFRV